MKTITLHIEDDVFSSMSDALRSKRLANSFGGVLDMASLAIVEAVNAKQSERTLRYRQKRPIINAVGK